MAVLSDPDVSDAIAESPMAVFAPVVATLDRSAFAPTATLREPVTREVREFTPIATLSEPVVSSRRASLPNATLF